MPLPSSRPAGGRSDRLFFTSSAIVVAGVVFVGFAPSYYLRPANADAALPPHLQLHGVAFSAWIALLLVQTALIWVRRTPWHRRLGWGGAGLAVLVTTAGIAAGILTARREAAFVAQEEVRAFLAIPVLSMVAFAALVTASLLWRSQPDVHKRLMLLATISILDAPVARWPGAPGASGVFAIVDLLIVAAIAYDLFAWRRLHPAYVGGGALVLASQLLRGVIGGTTWWQAMAGVVIG